MLVVDLTQPLSHGDPPFAEPSGYTDPPTQIEPWVTIGQPAGDRPSPFHVSRLQLSAHAGTHLDAPSHFHPGAASVSGLPAGDLAGRAVVVDLRDAGAELPSRLRQARVRAAQPDVTPLLLTPPQWLTPEAVDEVVAWGRPLIACAGETEGDADYTALSRLLGAGRWLASNLDVEKALLVQDGDLLVVAPLAVRDTEASPCRVLAIRI